VQSFYDGYAQREWDRLERHRVEFETTWRAMCEFIQPASRILDAGGGPGRYSIRLAELGHRVTLLDLSGTCLELARTKTAEAVVVLESILHGDVLDLSRFGGAAFDVVLLMGPLYHLTEAGDRERALAEALRVLRPRGVLFASFITRYAPFLDMLKDRPEGLEAKWGFYRTFLQEGTSLMERDGSSFADTYFAHPLEIEPLMERHGLLKLRLAATDPLLMPVEQAVNGLPREAFARWAELCYAVGTDPVVWGSAEHMLYVGRTSGRRAGGPTSGGTSR
jgi:SAM-dependent methyltransferase